MQNGFLSINVKIFTVLVVMMLPQKGRAFDNQALTTTTNQAAPEDSVQVDPDQAVSVYLDCNRCDFSYVREEIKFVNYVRDRFQAQVHIFVTDQSTGSGGRKYTLSFIGQGEHGGREHTLIFTSQDNDTFDEIRKGLVEIIKVGLVPYVIETSVASKIAVSYNEENSTSQVINDPWNNWVFEVYAGGYAEKESQRERLDIRYGFYATRVTEWWRIQARPYFNYNTRMFDSGDNKVKTIMHRNGFDGYVIRGLSDHWSIGLFGNLISTTFDNLDLRVRLSPAVEYSFLPYSMATRKEITLKYRFNAGYYNYIEETIFGKQKENLFRQSVEGNVRIRQPWGSIFASVEGSHYLHDLSKNRLELYSNLSFRLVRGLSLNLSGNLEIIHDQLFLPRGDASLEELLLQQRQLSTTFEVSGRIGFSYKFGSIYNNVVNTRL